ncbi:MAG: hypothetical protein GWP10_05810, partial [Nitrospiraceae bacterium]|nr:hypothetical protein [Nitrospiraceae bacterium]
MKIVSISPDRQGIVIFSGNRHLSGGSAAGSEMCLGEGDRMPENVWLVEPVGYPDMLRLMGGAERMLADYWGVQKWACVPGVPMCCAEEMG